MPQENSSPSESIEAPGPALSVSKPAVWLLSVALIVFVLILSGVPRAENDLFWQLRTGQDIVLQHSVPRVDVFSWTAKGHQWVVHEWLALAIFWLCYKAAPAYIGLFTLKLIVLSATIVTVFRHLCWAGRYKLIPILLLSGLVTISASIGFEMRPQMFTYLFLTLVCSIILRMRSGGYDTKKLFWLAPVFIVWANLHSGVIVGLFLLGAWCIGDFIDGINKADPQEGKAFCARAKSLLPVLAACALGTLVTPYGIAEYTDFASTLGNSNVINAVSEWASPTLHDSSGLNFCFLAGILLAGLLFAKRFVLLGDIIIFVALLHGSLMHFRNIPLFALIGTMIAMPYLADLWPSNKPAEDAADRKESSSIFGENPEIPAAVIASLGLVFIALASTHQYYQQPAAAPAGEASPVVQIAANSVSSSTEPLSAVAYIQANSFNASWQIYNGYDEGGYLISRTPQYPVSIDGRADLYFGSVFDDYMKLNRLSFDWKSVLAKYPADFILVAANSGLAKLIMTSPDWALVYASDPNLDSPSISLQGENSVIFVRRTPRNVTEINRLRKSSPAITSVDFLARYGSYPAVH